MRTENEIIKNVLEVAKVRENIRAVIRTELLLQREYLYSYQFCFIVKDISEYEDDEVLKHVSGKESFCFGETETILGCFKTRKRI